MFTLSAKLIFYIPHSFSLKDKRQVRRSITQKVRNKFNVSIAEIGTEDVLKTLTIGIAIVSGDASHRRELIEAIIRFLEESAYAELTEVEII
ncbi:MAG: DUF503 domain-containing protein [Defluviitaleaceae bacterium]|nr:DUF503 domain-containing protein [Defluviitaleaceae bacterium]